MKSFGLIRTNVGLTTNIKIMISSNYDLHLDSIDSTGELTVTKFKKKSFIEKNYWDELVSYFWDNLPADLAYFIKYDDDLYSMSKDYSSQYDELYYYGARNIANNKDYSEEFEYFAPLYVNPKSLPSHFIIFRVDGPGFGKVSKSNVREQVFNKFKTIKLFDLGLKTKLGYWLNINFTKNSFFPKSPLEISFENNEFSHYNGIGYDTQGYFSKSLFLDTIYEEEKEIFEMEKIIFDGWKNNKIVFPNILNFSFLFDDTPADADTLRKWSINRYYGFYLENLEKVSSFSPYSPAELVDDIQVLDNNILSTSYSTPFKEKFSSQKTYWVEWRGDYYKIERLTEATGRVLNTSDNFSEEYTTSFVSKFKIISDVNLKGKESELNQNTGRISTTWTNRLLNSDGTNFDISEWTTADIWLIEIDGNYHNLVRETNEELVNGILQTTTKIRINSDYTFLIDENTYSYYINKKDPSYTVTKNFLVKGDDKPMSFPIYKVKFSDIKDFDDRIIDTNYSKFEYEKEFELTETEESKMYLTNLDSVTEPRELDDFLYKSEVVNIPVSSEYTVNWETFKISQGELSEVWKRNPVYCRWAYQNSISGNDMPYLLNNSLVFEDYNRTTNPFELNPSRIERNLDYFLTINSSTASYLWHSLHVEKQTNGQIDNTFKFELDKYLNVATNYNFDYFTWFFGKENYFNDGKIKTYSNKWSLFNPGDDATQNSTLFRGIKYNLFNVENKKYLESRKSSVEKEVINLRNLNSFQDWKFAVLLSDNDFTVDWIDSNSTSKSATVSQFNNTMSWRIFDEWQMDKTYNTGDLVIMDDMLFESQIDNNITTNPTYDLGNGLQTKSAPYNNINDWSPYNNDVFWNPNGSFPGNGIDGNIVYNFGDYWICPTPIGTNDFWNPIYATYMGGYSVNDIVLFKGKWWISMVANNQQRPDYQAKVLNEGHISLSNTIAGGGTNPTVIYWEDLEVYLDKNPNANVTFDPKWKKIEIWHPRYSYASSTYVIHNDVVWKASISIEAGIEPLEGSDWTRIYSLLDDTTIQYSPTTNPIIQMNDVYYECLSNPDELTLENGINIYINEKWENVLVNITISDNTIPNLSETDRDGFYKQFNKKFTAQNFISAINNISNKYGFTDYVNYIVVDKNNNIYKWNYSNIEGIPYMLFCETPDSIQMKRNSLTYNKIDLPADLKPSKFLAEVNDDLSNLNDWNGISPASEIVQNQDSPKIFQIYNGGGNPLNDVIWRFSGFYAPIFYEIELFKKDFYTSSVGNYKFDTEYTNFGIIKERRIRKINHLGDTLKLQNVESEKSYFPMVDEFGYTTLDFFMFKSTWDDEYHIRTDRNPNVAPLPIIEPVINTNDGIQLPDVKISFPSVGIQLPINNPSL